MPDFSGSVQPSVFVTSTYGFASVVASEAAAAMGAEAGLILTSGMAAIGTLTLSLLSQGDELIVHRTLYSNTVAMIRARIARFGIKVVPVHLSDPANLDASITGRTRLVYFEPPVNPVSEILDIAAISARAHAAGVHVAVDSTFASPALQRPLEHGADLVLHSLSKYINGHGDVLGGALLGDGETIHKLHENGLRYITGAALSPMAAMLDLRGLKTLPTRSRMRLRLATVISPGRRALQATAAQVRPFRQTTPRRSMTPARPEHGGCRSRCSEIRASGRRER